MDFPRIAREEHPGKSVLLASELVPSEEEVFELERRGWDPSWYSSMAPLNSIHPKDREIRNTFQDRKNQTGAGARCWKADMGE
jgi:hypothetical protein